MRLVQITDTLWINPDHILTVRVFRGDQPPHTEILLAGRDKGVLCDLTLEEVSSLLADANGAEQEQVGFNRGEGMRRAGLR